MKKISLLLVTLVTLFACNNEDFLNPPDQGLQVNTDFLTLSDSSGTTAGNLVINAEVPEVTLRWNTGSLCNLDTTQTTLKLSKGSAILPIKWLEKLENGAYGPEGVAFKAGVQIIAGEKSQYVPLVWAEKIDSTEVLNSTIQTRSAGDVMPRVVQIMLYPTTVNMKYTTGGAMSVILTNAPFAVFDVSEITSDMNIDMSRIPNYVTSSQVLGFRWTAAGSPNYSFSAHIIAMTDGIAVTGIVNYTNNGVEEPGGVECGGLVWAPGNLKCEYGIYSFMEKQDMYTGVLGSLSDPTNATVDYPDYFCANTLTPMTSYQNDGDPCTKVFPEGTWRTPSGDEIENIRVLSGIEATTSSGVLGFYFGTSTPPIAALEQDVLFLPFTGFYNDNYTQFAGVGTYGYYWTSTLFNPDINYVFRSLTVKKDENPKLSLKHALAKCPIRCVRNP